MSWVHLWCVVAPLLASVLAQTTPKDEHFHEELVVRPLSGDHVNTYFQFTTRWHYGQKENLYHTQLTPRVIAELLQQFDVRELHIGLTQGLWRYETWGYPIVEATSGAEMWAWFKGHNLTDEAVDKQWAQLANVFSGVLCASLNFVDNTNSISPRHLLRPQFMPANQEKFVRYASLPREIVCTENLTPWKKLLPCGSASGFASLLNSGYVHNTKYHSLGLKVRTLCQDHDEDNCILELTQTANLVYDLRLLEQSGNDFSLRRLFGMGLNGYCELATTSKIYVQRNELGARYQLVPLPPAEVQTTRGGYTVLYGVYDMQEQFQDQGERLFNIAWLAPKGEERRNRLKPAPPPIYVHRYLLGQGQERGRIVTEVTNSHYAPLPIVVQELIPWYVHAYLHTLNIRRRSMARHEYGRETLPFKLLHYAPGKQRELPTHLEIGFVLPGQSSALITIDVDYLVLKWLEYPPDANHGHYINAALVFSSLPMGTNYSALPLEGHLFAHSFNATRPSYVLGLHTEALIVSLPTPDFSMPYNVICLACTVVALAFGPIHSVATKVIVVVRPTSAGPRNFLKRLKEKLFSRGGQESTPMEGKREGVVLDDPCPDEKADGDQEEEREGKEEAAEALIANPFESLSSAACPTVWDL
ncbi:GPI transamidase component PIG-T [Drosophila pseudoobscura]|uniref:GPI transamidase component PIG-T n=1 Tax=Drosophila pseudoobscura pseudoobscura TaxID=46245 RepID=A0A6I8UHS9_DROPS|nr:GPI transamidase component PIG-T [Drosophila pseudoobscura]